MIFGACHATACHRRSRVTKVPVLKYCCAAVTRRNATTAVLPYSRTWTSCAVYVTGDSPAVDGSFTSRRMSAFPMRFPEELV